MEHLVSEAPNKTLIITVGLPRSGKSTWVKEKSEMENCPIVCPDSIRLALHGQAYNSAAEPFVWAIAKTMVKSLFLSGHNKVILNSTGNTKERRDDWKSDEWALTYKVFNTSKEVCIQRAKDTGQDYLIPVIEKMAEEHQPLTEEELPRSIPTESNWPIFRVTDLWVK